MSSLSDLPPNHLTEHAIARTPFWARARLRRWDDALFQRVQPFVTDRYWSDRHSINVFSVVGTQHPDYAGMTWLEFLQRGKRMPHNMEKYLENPGYYDEVSNKTPTMYYLSLDGLRWYVGADGNHRTCIARFAFDAGLHGDTRTMLHGVHLEDYRVDWTFYRIHEALKQTLGPRERIEARRETVAREDTGGWMHESYRVFLVHTDRKGERLLARIEAEHLLHRRLRGGPLCRLASRLGLRG